MKKTIATALVLSMALSMTACSTAEKTDETKIRFKTDDPVPEEETTEETAETTPVDPDLQTFTFELGNEKKPETTEVRLSGYCDGDINDYVSAMDLYGYDYLHSGVVGLVGSPVQLTYDDVKRAKLTFVYDPDELGNMPETNLILLSYTGSSYDTVVSELDTKSHTVSADIAGDGVYLLADAYQWYACWGYDVSKYEYEIDVDTSKSAWERECETGSIMELADKDWAVENAPYFLVSTPEELASAVYYINAWGTYDQKYYITLKNDIDITGYEWEPIGWHGPSGGLAFRGVVDGQGYTINGMTIDLGYQDAGFIGVGQEISVYDINFTNAYVSSTANVGIVGGQINWTNKWSNINVQGEIAGDAHSFGAIIGHGTSTSFIECSADVTRYGEEFNYLNYKEYIEASSGVTEAFTLTLNEDYTITRDEVEGYDSLTWHIELNGVQVLDRGAEDFDTKEPELVLSTEYQWIRGEKGTHSIYLLAWDDTYDTYVRVSNIIEYTID